MLLHVPVSLCFKHAVVRRAGMLPLSRFAEKPANTPVTSLAANHVHFNVQNPTADLGRVRLVTIGNRFTNPVSDSLFDWRNRKPDSETENLPR